jgi:tryptophanase
MFPASDNPVIIEPFRIKSVEPLPMTSREQRIEYLKHAHYNPFLLQSSQVTFDFLTDSGTSAMSSAQWAAMMGADESYAGAKSWEHLYEAVHELTGFTHILPTHQGRAAERILYGVVGGKGKVFLSNTHFDTTRANIEYTGATAIDIPIKEGLDPFLIHPFKGNLDTEKLEHLILHYGREAIGAVILTVTNNSGGGQPVSLENAREVSRICRKHKVLFVLDCCRIAENAYFIRHREEAYKNNTDLEIAREMFRLADAAIMSAKKDALVNMGGFLALNDEMLAQQCTNLLIITEGYTTYGGLSGRDMEAMAVGLKEVFIHGYLTYRIRSTAYLGEKLLAKGVPVMQPIGGHAVYIDARSFYPNIPVDQYPGQALVCELYKTGGIRAVEVGSLMFGKYDERGKLIPSAMDLVRLAIPRRVYTQSHIDYVIALFDELIRTKDQVKGYRILFETPMLRHFTCRLEPVS